ncbi:hypothetical protein JCM3775_003102 [Rhodotorula graminis]|uniref:Uncharacterized protein n=1 Tax=Rhodotorula graminis (strain WP1) TaxID=578459 RepID=A0A194S7R7_RHOGW|nr:uncharacterized protein RHOBADRAFT_42878 [Rhodotorula graminis WP1]KPV76535.1 hypothetical protein RHOBADRAFT_42878 [Rhodotorula graminis WP1]
MPTRRALPLRIAALVVSAWTLAGVAAGNNAPPFSTQMSLDGEDLLSVWFERNGYAYKSDSAFECEKFQLLFFGSAAPLSLDVLRFPLPLNESAYEVLHYLGDWGDVAPGEVATWDTRGAEVGDEFVVRLRDDEGRVSYSEPGMVVSPEDSFPSRECTPRPGWTLLGATCAALSIVCFALAVAVVFSCGEHAQDCFSRARRIAVDGGDGEPVPPILPSAYVAPTRRHKRTSYEKIKVREEGARIDEDEAEFVGTSPVRKAGRG